METQAVKLQDQLPMYEPPVVVTVTQDEILEELGPAQALYGQLGGIGC
jgi:hypothetical protein